MLCSLSAFGADCVNPISGIGFQDGRTGAPFRVSWFLDEPVLSQTITGHDFDQPVTLSPAQRSFTYVPELPGRKHMTLTVATECGMFSRDLTYDVDLCNVQPAPITVSKPAVNANETFTASVDLRPGHTVRWSVLGGTLSSTEGETVQVTAGASGSVRLSAFITRGDSNSAVCEVRSTATVAIQQCQISALYLLTNPATPYFPPGFDLLLTLVGLAPHESATFTAENAEILATGSDWLRVKTPATGFFRVLVHVSTGTCTRTVTWTYLVQDCAPKAVVSGGSSCDAGTITADFTGTAPFFGYWSDGEPFYTMDSQLVRVANTPGTYTISSFTDSNSCPGEVTGSAVITSLGLPEPTYAYDDIVNGWYYGTRTCPGLVRVARLLVPVPDGVTVTWSIVNGTIVSGQGTPVLEFYGNEPGNTTVTSTFTNAAGCTSQYTFPFFVTLGTPEASVTVEPSTIDAGGTAVVKVTRLNDYATGWSVTSSLGDNIFPIGEVDEYTYAYEYRSTNGAGVATISVNMQNECFLTNTASTTLTINAGAPVQATATVDKYGTDCTNFYVYANLTGTAPFTGTWSNGQTFYAEYPWISLYPDGPGTYTITQFSDANGPGVVTGSATFDYVALPAPDFAYNTTSACPNSTVTATLTTPLPEGATANWEVQGGTIVSGQGTSSIVIQAGEFYVAASVQLVGPGACSAKAAWQSLNVGGYVQQPWFDLYGVYQGQSTTFGVWVDPNTATLQFENSFGDAMAIESNPWPGYYVISYTSTHGTGDSLVRIFGTTNCGVAFEATRTMQVLPAPPTATFTASPSACGQVVTATFTGTAPFTGTWSDTGETFTTSEASVTHNVTTGGWIYLSSFHDATGTPGISSSIYVEATNSVPYTQVGGSSSFCTGTTQTYTAYNVPAGAQVIWSLVGTAGRIVASDATTVTIEGLEPGSLVLESRIRLAEGCEGYGSGFFIGIEGQIAAPVMTLPVTTVAPGGSFDFTLEYPYSANYSTLYWEATAGEISYVSSDWFTYTLRYTAPAEGATSATITAYAATSCGTQTMQATGTVSIEP